MSKVYREVSKSVRYLFGSALAFRIAITFGQSVDEVFEYKGKDDER